MARQRRFSWFRPRRETGQAPPIAGASGFSLTEAVVVVAIALLTAVTVAGNLRQKIDQGRVDGVTTRLEGALNTLRRQSLSYQTNCTLSWALTSSGTSITASADQIGSKLVVNASTCDFPAGVPKPRFSPPLRSQDNTVEVTISPNTFTITAFGGLAGDQPLILRIRPNRTSQSGDFERCLRMEAYTAAISRGTWVNGACQRNR